MTLPITLPVTHPTGIYNVIVGANLIANVREMANIQGALALVTDSNVGLLYASQIDGADCIITVPAGEKYKTLPTVASIYDQLLVNGFDRKGTIVALGGGVIGDMAGFAAASYMRGLDFVQCPTSLLAMVDASVGGKTGVDLPQGKNLVGAFKQPTAVLVDITTLRTLPPAELVSGMAEIVKHGLMTNPDLLMRLESSQWSMDSTPWSDWQALVADAIRVKRDVVQEDPFEHGRRALLNLGHTFGHAIEQVSGYTVRHGEGVAMGLVAAANLSASLEYCDPALQTRIESILTHLNLPTRVPAHLPPDALYAAMGSDKKKAAGKLRFILMRGVGDLFIVNDVEKTAVLRTLERVRMNG
jgi:shikimate kinase / 3-dehydroquinate synthase